MVTEIPDDIAPELVPLSWLVGSWTGTGVIDYRVGEVHYTGEFVMHLSFEVEGAALKSDAAARLTDPADGVVETLLREVGFWRLAHAADNADAGPALLPATAAREPRTASVIETWRAGSGGFPIEVSFVRADGSLELCVGEVQGPRIDIGSDAVVQAPSAKPLTAATRMYGLVDSHLLWAWDVAALGSELASHASARLAKS